MGNVIIRFTEEGFLPKRLIDYRSDAKFKKIESDQEDWKIADSLLDNYIYTTYMYKTPHIIYWYIAYTPRLIKHMFFSQDI